MGVGCLSGSRNTAVPNTSRLLMTAAWAICVMGSRNGIAKATWSPHQKESTPSRSTCWTTSTRSSSVGIQGRVAGSARRNMVLTPIFNELSRGSAISETPLILLVFLQVSLTTHPVTHHPGAGHAAELLASRTLTLPCVAATPATAIDGRAPPAVCANLGWLREAAIS